MIDNILFDLIGVGKIKWSLTILIDKEGYEFARIIGYIDFENKSLLEWLSKQL